MDKHDRIQQLHRIFSQRRTPVRLSELAEKLECTEKTVLRNIDVLRDHMSAPLVYDKEQKGWLYNKKDNKFELPGLWLTAEEIQGLAVVLDVLGAMELGSFSSDFAAIQAAIDKLLQTRGISNEQFKQWVSYLPKKRHKASTSVFQKISRALIDNCRITLGYEDYKGVSTQREVSPLKIVHYDEKWYLDAWCHKREGFRSFMLARIVGVTVLDSSSIDTDDQARHEHFASSYGIFAGRAKRTAKLKFSGATAREAAGFEWHPDQRGEWRGRSYELHIPYSDDRELVRTLLGFGEGVEVLAPASLKKRVLAKAKQIVTTYDPAWGGGRF